jgi:hypothetical protein
MPKIGDINIGSGDGDLTIPSDVPSGTSTATVSTGGATSTPSLMVRGPKGEKGDKGDKGDQGDAGEDGQDGPAGSNLPVIIVLASSPFLDPAAYSFDSENDVLLYLSPIVNQIAGPPSFGDLYLIPYLSDSRKSGIWQVISADESSVSFSRPEGYQSGSTYQQGQEVYCSISSELFMLDPTVGDVVVSVDNHAWIPVTGMLSETINQGGGIPLSAPTGRVLQLRTLIAGSGITLSGSNDNTGAITIESSGSGGVMELPWIWGTSPDSTIDIESEEYFNIRPVVSNAFHSEGSGTDLGDWQTAGDGTVYFDSAATSLVQIEITAHVSLVNYQLFGALHSMSLLVSEPFQDPEDAPGRVGDNGLDQIDVMMAPAMKQPDLSAFNVRKVFSVRLETNRKYVFSIYNGSQASFELHKYDVKMTKIAPGPILN